MESQALACRPQAPPLLAASHPAPCSRLLRAWSPRLRAVGVCCLSKRTGSVTRTVTAHVCGLLLPLVNAKGEKVPQSGELAPSAAGAERHPAPGGLPATLETRASPPQPLRPLHRQARGSALCVLWPQAWPHACAFFCHAGTGGFLARDAFPDHPIYVCHPPTLLPTRALPRAACSR